MPRILGFDIPEDKLVEYSLRYVPGIGKCRSKVIMSSLDFLTDTMRAKELTADQNAQIAAFVDEKVKEDGWLIGGDLRRAVKADISRLMSVRCHRGTRHKLGLPVRGQITQKNARSCRRKRNKK